MKGWKYFSQKPGEIVCHAPFTAKNLSHRFTTLHTPLPRKPVDVFQILFGLKPSHNFYKKGESEKNLKILLANNDKEKQVGNLKMILGN